MQVMKANKHGFDTREDIHFDSVLLKLFPIGALLVSKSNPLLPVKKEMYVLWSDHYAN